MKLTSKNEAEAVLFQLHSLPAMSFKACISDYLFFFNLGPIYAI